MADKLSVISCQLSEGSHCILTTENWQLTTCFPFWLLASDSLLLEGRYFRP